MMRSSMLGRYRASAKFRYLFSEIGSPPVRAACKESFQTRIWSGRMFVMSNDRGTDACVRLTVCIVAWKWSSRFRLEISNSRSRSLLSTTCCLERSSFLHESRDAGQIDVEVDLLVPVVLQVVQQGPQVLDAAMPVDLRHAGNRLRQDRVQPGVQREQVPPMGDEALQVLGVGEVQAASQAGQDHPQAEDVGQRVVMADLVLPGYVAGQVDGPGDFGRAIPDR